MQEGGSGVAEETGERSKLPFGASPGVFAVGCVALVALGVYTVLPMFKGTQPTPTATAAVANAPAPAVVTQAAPTPGSPANPNAAPPAEDPLATFLVRFGRNNPFSPLSVVTGAVPSGQTGTPPRQTGSSTLQDLRERVSNMQPGGTAGQNQGGSSNDGFVLTGIVRL